jgi:hypothetical protein
MIRPGSLAGGRAAYEPFWVGMVGGGQYPGAAGLRGCCPAVVDVGGGVQAEAAVAVDVVVPAEEVLAVGSAPAGHIARESDDRRIWGFATGTVEHHIADSQTSSSAAMG